MKIAVTYENGEIFGHFGHTKQFKVYEAENGKILSSKVVDTNGSGHGALAGMLSALNIDVLICGGIGGGAQMALAQAGIKLFGGVQQGGRGFSNDNLRGFQFPGDDLRISLGEDHFIAVGEFVLQRDQHIRFAGQSNQQFFHSIHSFSVSISRQDRPGKEKDNILDK
jgi:predicted Fe-Mo cluster-binding NifX family protein